MRPTRGTVQHRRWTAGPQGNNPTASKRSRLSKKRAPNQVLVVKVAGRSDDDDDDGLCGSDNGDNVE